MRLKKIIYVSLFSLGAMACVEDKGNYDYHELAELEISGVEDNLSVLTYEHLRLNPDLGVAARPEDQYEYEWKVINQDESNEVTLIGENRNLDYQVELAAGIYTLYFTVKEKDSGLYWQKNYQLTVSDTTTEGWMVLCSDGGRARLDMVSTVTGETYADLLKSNKDMPEYQGPRKIQWLSKYAAQDSPYYLLTDQGATRLGKNKFVWKEEYEFKYEVATLADLCPYSITLAGFGRMMVSGTDAYYNETISIDGLYGTKVNKDFSVAPYVGANVGATMYAAVYLMYDIDNKRFVTYCPMMRSEALGGYEPLQEITGMEEIARKAKGSDKVVGDAFEEYPVGYEYVYMENTKYDAGNAKMGTTYTLLKDTEGKLHLYGIQLGDFMLFADCTYIIGRAYYGDLSACTDIGKEGNLYAFSSLRNYMYYAVGGTLYRIDLSEKPLRAEKQFTLSGETITCLKFNLYQKAANANRSFDLVVGSTKNGKGTLRIYEGLSGEGDFSTVTPAVYTGFTDIVDVTYRER